MRYVVEVELDGVTTSTEQETWEEAIELMGNLCREFPTASIELIDKEEEGAALLMVNVKP